MRVISLFPSLFLLFCSLAAGQSALDQAIREFHSGEFQSARKRLEGLLAKDANNGRARVFFALTRAGMGECSAVTPDLYREYSSNASAELKRLAGIALAGCIGSQLKAEHPADADLLYQTARRHMRLWNDTLMEMFQKTPASYRVNQISGEVFETQGRYAEAAAEYRKAIAKNPKALDLHFRLGRALLLHDRGPNTLEEARREFEAELAINAEDAASEYQIGQILVAQGKTGLPRFERALRLRPDFTEAMIAVAKASVEAKQYPEAIQLLESALQKQPQSEAARYNLMLAYRNSGQMEKAREQKAQLDKARTPPSGEFSEFLKKLGEKGSQK
jgi:tetratricopeptide (TPR) repeat protein